MTPAWTLRREEWLSHGIVSPDVFNLMVDRLHDWVGPYQHTLEIEAGQRNAYLYFQGLLSHLQRKNAEETATWIDVKRLAIGVCVYIPIQGYLIAALGSCPP